MNVIFASGVLEEVSESANYYEGEVEGLGQAFLRMVRDAVEDIKRDPLIFRIVEKDYRRHLLNRFPFAVIYRLEGDTIFILAVMHMKRKPTYWRERRT